VDEAWALVVAIVGVAGAATLAVLGLVFVRRRVPLVELEANHEVGSIVLNVVGTAYAVLLSFCVAIVWGQLNDASEAVQQEASHLGTLRTLAEGFDPAETERIRAAADRYIQAVIDDEWPQLAEGRGSETAWDLHNALWQAVYDARPQSPERVAVFSAALAEMRGSDGGRRVRLQNAGDQVPPALWVVLVVGGLMLVLSTYMFGTKRVVTQAIMTVMMTTAIVGALFLIAAMNHPYTGAIRVGPDAFEALLAGPRR
jgi:hypothetical protein